MISENIKYELQKKTVFNLKLSAILLIAVLIYIIENYNNSSKVIEKKYAITFIQNFFKGDSNNYNYSYINGNPNISVIIPLYNCENSIVNTILSVQIQTLKNFEIILINDYSTDNTSKIVNEMMVNDKRINIINNHKNMGILYSRSIGALNARGKYIYCLDDDDIFYDKNLFYNIFNIAESHSYDIVEFKCFEIKKYSYTIKLNQIKDSPFNNHLINYTLKQPELGIFPISKNEKYYSNDYHLWGKSIKTKIYQKAVNRLSEKHYTFYNCWTEDISMLFIIFNLAKSFLFTGIYGIIHFDLKKSTTYTLNYAKKLMSELFLLNILIEYIQNKEKNKKYIFQKLKSILKSKYMPFFNAEHKNYLKFLFDKITQINILNENERKILVDYKNFFNIN